LRCLRVPLIHVQREVRKVLNEGRWTGLGPRLRRAGA